MATVKGPEKAVLPEDQLPPITVFDDGSFGYITRYRFISEDGNRFSAYSPNYYVKPNYVFERPSGIDQDTVEVVRQGPYVNAFWEGVFVKDRVSSTQIKTESRYDLYISWCKNEHAGNHVWIPAERFDGTIQGFAIPPSYELEDGTVVEEEPTHFSVEIYIRATNRSRNHSNLLVYKKDDVNIVPPVPPPAN